MTNLQEEMDELRRQAREGVDCVAQDGNEHPIQTSNDMTREELEEIVSTELEPGKVTLVKIEQLIATAQTALAQMKRADELQDQVTYWQNSFVRAMDSRAVSQSMSTKDLTEVAKMVQDGTWDRYEAEQLAKLVEKLLGKINGIHEYILKVQSRTHVEEVDLSHLAEILAIIEKEPPKRGS